MPIAPFIALMTVLIDVRIDAKRLLWLYRRPVPFIAQDIGNTYLPTYLLACAIFSSLISNFVRNYMRGIACFRRVKLALEFISVYVCTCCNLASILIYGNLITSEVPLS